MVFGKTRGDMAHPAFGCGRSITGLDVTGIAALRETQIQVALMTDRASAPSKNIMTSKAVSNTIRIRVGFGRPCRESTEDEKAKQDYPKIVIMTLFFEIHLFLTP